MRKKLTAIFIATLSSFTTACADELPLGMLAVKIPEAAVAAIKFRNAGKPKTYLTNALPPKGSQMTRVGKEMHRIADEVYEYEWVQGLPYFVYTQQRFQLELAGRPTPRNFGEVADAVKGCQTNESTDEKRISCITVALDEFSKTQQ